MIRIETSRQTVVTFKTLKAAENRVARDTAWFANAAEPGTLGTVEVSPRFDQIENRTLFDVQYVVWEVLPEAPEGAQVRVTGPYSGAAAYGYVGTVEARDAHGRVHVANGRSRWILQANDDVVVEALPEPVTGLHLEDGLCCAEDDHEGAEGWEVASAGSLRGASSERRETFGVIPRDYAPDPIDSLIEQGDTVSWWVRVDGQGGDSTTEVPSLEAALDVWREVLKAQPLADVQVLTAVNDREPRVYADADEHDTCSVHRDAVFSKDGPCPVCIEENERAWITAYKEQYGDAAADRAAATLRRMLASTSLNLVDDERAALQHAIYVLEG